MGSGDIQSLADLGNSFEVVRSMRLAPVTKEALLQLAAATLAPVTSMALTFGLGIGYRKVTITNTAFPRRGSAASLPGETAKRARPRVNGSNELR